MPLTFHIPTYPLPRQFSDPYNDWFEDPGPPKLLRRDPRSLDAGELAYLFNSWLPAGTFEEMAAYVPHALRLLEADDPQEGAAYLLDQLIIWCEVEKNALAREPAFLAGMQDAFAQLFRLWTADTAWNSRHRDYWPRRCSLVDSLLGAEDMFSRVHGRDCQDWLRAGHYLPRLYALDSVPHAAWALWVSDPDNWIEHPPFPIPAATRRRAIDMVDDWLLNGADAGDTAIWDPVLIRHREQLHLFPDAE